MIINLVRFNLMVQIIFLFLKSPNIRSGLFFILFYFKGTNNKNTNKNNLIRLRIVNFNFFKVYGSTRNH
jgi:hypothetical protein